MSDIDDWLEGAYEERTEPPDPQDDFPYNEDDAYDAWKDNKLDE
jgi:hypothetical protein